MRSIRYFTPYISRYTEYDDSNKSLKKAEGAFIEVLFSYVHSVASYPGPSHAKIEREKKGLVSTVCACTRFSHFFGKQDSSVYFQDTKNIKTS